jgi:hypothetical protein
MNIVFVILGVDAMREMNEMQEPLFMTVKLEDFVPADHLLRSIRLLINEALKRFNESFSVTYADSGRAAIAPRSCFVRCCCRCPTRCAASACHWNMMS